MGTPRLLTHSAILAGYALGAVALYWRLPAEIPPSWTGRSGDVTWLGATMVAFLLPTASAVIETLLRGLCLRHPIDQHDTANVLLMFDSIMARVAVFVLGVDPRTIMETLGHSQISLTMNTYSHVLPTLQQHAADLMDDVLGTAKR